LVENPEGKTPLERFRCKLEDNFRMDVREIGWEYMDWMHLAQDRDQLWAFGNTAMNLGVS
jgi:hypothetical protein